jgi:hypothetical protein
MRLVNLRHYLIAMLCIFLASIAVSFLGNHGLKLTDNQFFMYLGFFLAVLVSLGEIRFNGKKPE